MRPPWLLFSIPVAAIVLTACGGSTSAAPSTPADPLVKGAEIYKANCATCHMADGSGVPDMQPALVDNAVAAGDATKVIRIV